MTGELAAARRELGEDGELAPRPSPHDMANVIRAVQSRQIVHAVGKDLLRLGITDARDPAQIIEEEGLAQASDSGELEAWVVAAIDANPEASEQVRAGNPKAIGPIVGAVMREAGGRADGGEVTRLIHEKLRATQ